MFSIENIQQLFFSLRELEKKNNKQTNEKHLGLSLGNT